ncbi:MAG: thiamine-phosphate kinase [Actinomycetales bacterium]
MPHDVQGEVTLADLGESGVLARVFPLLPQPDATLVGPGDDAAVVAAPDGRVVVTTDQMVEGGDWRAEWSGGYDVGWKAAAQNLADIAGMGAVPTALVVSLTAPPSTPVAWVERLAEGLAAACNGTGAGVVGGDLSAGERIVVTVTALGDLQGRPPVLRSGATVGDSVALAGRVGWSAAGLELLRARRGDIAPHLVAAHLRPEPPYDAGPAAATGGATALLDVSDGLLRDAGRIADASGVTLDLDVAALRADSAALEDAADGMADRALALRWVLTGGEDHPLLATFPPGPVPAPYRTIGAVVARGDGPVLADGRPPAELIGEVTGWDHFEPDRPQT